VRNQQLDLSHQISTRSGGTDPFPRFYLIHLLRDLPSRARNAMAATEQDAEDYAVPEAWDIFGLCGTSVRLPQTPRTGTDAPVCNGPGRPAAPLSVERVLPTAAQPSPWPSPQPSPTGPASSPAPACKTAPKARFAPRPGRVPGPAGRARDCSRMAPGRAGAAAASRRVR
jgi:hypothetical protein